jgi:pyruvate dehydrogenase E1 component alpha subunit/2-oxoisovalerate dehydrogenase E1 component alpha subunit
MDRALGYGIPGVQADGNDVLAVYQVSREAVDRARAGGGVTLIELMTYRRRGHAEHDNQSYVPPAEIGEWEQKDPLDAWVRRLTESAWATVDEMNGVDQRIQQELDTALATCIDEPMPDIGTALTGVYADPKSAGVEWYRTLPDRGSTTRPSA